MVHKLCNFSRGASVALSINGRGSLDNEAGAAATKANTNNLVRILETMTNHFRDPQIPPPPLGAH